MAYDEGLAELLRADLAGLPVTEKKMFGGLCFMFDGNMLCGTHKYGAMFRVGKENYDAALAMPGVGPMAFTGRPMAGMVDVSDDGIADDAVRAKLTALALAFVKSLPAK